MDRSEAVSTIREALQDYREGARNAGLIELFRRMSEAGAALGWLVEHCDTMEATEGALREALAVYETDAALGSSVAAKGETP